MAEAKKKEATVAKDSKSSDALWAKVRKLEKIVEAILPACERHFGADLDRSGAIGDAMKEDK